jgi:putative aldouronate transport system permease protein
MKRKINLFDAFNYTLMIILSVIFLYPVVLTFSISFSSPEVLGHERIFLLPKGFSLDAFKFLLSDGRILQYYINSIVYALLGAFFMLLFTSLMAYPMSIEDFRGKKFVNLLMVITMFFGGGLIPYYFTIRALGMIDTLWVMVIPGAVSAYNVIIFRTFFKELPAGLRESAQIDGAGHYRILFNIILPLSKPLLATFALFTIVGKWNDFMTALLFLRSEEMHPVQMLLRKMLILLDYKDAKNTDLMQIFSNINTRTIKSAAIVITITPILCVYPFLQKYFAKGMLVGSIKA